MHANSSGVPQCHILRARYNSALQDLKIHRLCMIDSLLQVEHDFLAANDYRSLMEKVAVHPRLVPHGRPKGEVGSKGVHVHFNTGGIQRCVPMVLSIAATAAF